MKKSDIKIGAEYAVARSEWEYENGTASRVRALGEGKVKQGWGFGAKDVTGTRIQYLDMRTGEDLTYLNNDGETVPRVGTVPNRQIRQDWTSYHERHKRRAEEARAYQRRTEDAQNDRARKLVDIIEALRAAGVEDQKSYVFNARVEALLERYLPEIFDHNAEGGRTSNTRGPLAGSYVGFIQHGKPFEVPADVLLLLASQR